MELAMIVLVGFATIFLIPLAIAPLFQWLWNITMPEVFDLRKIAFWQAYRLLLIAEFLFGGLSMV